MHGHGLGLPGHEVIESHLFRRFSAGGGGTTIADLSTWDSRPDGSVNGDYGLGPNGLVYRWIAASSMWVPASMYGDTFTQLGATLGASVTPTGWTVDNPSGDGAAISTDGTVLSIGSGTASNQTEVQISVTTGAEIWGHGYLWVTGLSGSRPITAGGIMLDDVRRRNFGPDSTGDVFATFGNGTGTTEQGSSNRTSIATRAWVEFHATGTHEAVVRVAHSPRADAYVDFLECDTFGSSPLLRVGDRTTSGAGVTNVEAFSFFAVT